MLTPNEASQLDRWLTMEPDYYGPSTQIGEREVIELSRNTAADTYLGPHTTNDDVSEFWDALRDAAHQPHAARLTFDDIADRDSYAAIAWAKCFPDMEYPF